MTHLIRVMGECILFLLREHVKKLDRVDDSDRSIALYEKLREAIIEEKKQ